MSCAKTDGPISSIYTSMSCFCSRGCLQGGRDDFTCVKFLVALIFSIAMIRLMFDGLTCKLTR